MLALTGLSQRTDASQDTVAPPFHGYKFMAALQRAQQGPAPIYLQVVWGAGHNQGTGILKRSATRALSRSARWRTESLVR